MHINGFSEKFPIEWYAYHVHLAIFHIFDPKMTCFDGFYPNLTSGDLGKVMIYTFSESAEKMLSIDMYMKGYLTPTKSFSMDFSDINGQKTHLTSINHI